MSSSSYPYFSPVQMNYHSSILLVSTPCNVWIDLDSNAANYESEDNLHIFHCQKNIQAAPTETVQEPSEAHTLYI